MADDLLCYRCGASLERLTPPISRQDKCSECAVFLHVCMMCRFFDPAVPKQCREDDAEEVMDKENLNFCEWYEPAADAFDADRAGQATRAKQGLAALFGDDDSEKPAGDELQQRAEDLFK